MLRGLSRENLAECAGLCRHSAVNGTRFSARHRFQPDNGKCLFCSVVAVIAFCWREPHADI